MSEHTTLAESLIKKDIKRRTNYGENYNRQSFYDTIDECVEIGEQLVSVYQTYNDPDIAYLNNKCTDQALREIRKSRFARDLAEGIITEEDFKNYVY